MSTPPSGSTLIALACVVALAFAIETALGFGATIVTVAIGSFLAPIEVILPAFLPINLALSLYVAARYRREVDLRLLFLRIVPLMGLGLPLGMAAFRGLGTARLRLGLGVFVTLLSLFEIARVRRASPSAAPGKATGVVLLVAAGIAHGAFATGGPLAVYVTGRELPDKARFRATLSALWLILNLALLASYAIDRRLGAGSLAMSAAFVPSLAAGMVIGEWAHRRAPIAAFRALVFALLLVAGLLLAARALPELPKAAAATIGGAPVRDRIARVDGIAEA